MKVEKMSVDEYYLPPTDDVFQDIKESALKIWKTYDDQYGYATAKCGRITDLRNFRDNAAYIVAMFDTSNQCKLLSLVKLEETKHYIRRLLAMAYES